MQNMQVHVKVLGAIFIALSSLGLIFAVFIMFGFGALGLAGAANAANDPDAAVALPFFGILGAALTGFMVLVTLPGLLAGIGLLQFKPWGRILGIIVSALSLLGFPWFTLFGAYGLWVLLSKETEQLFHSRTASLTTAP
jgi:hypothetical protein